MIKEVKKQRRIGYKTTEIFETCSLCKQSNFWVRVGVMRWDWV